MAIVSKNLWEPAYLGGRLEELEPTECLRLLVTSTVGRIGYSTDDEQRIVPVNYVVFDDHVVFRTSPDNELARQATDRPIAFEVDHLDRYLQAGWSVLVTGVAEELPSASLRAMDFRETPEPWASGVRSLYLQIPVSTITGRRVHPA
jgi:nitroimidazol reductase NimA-like FMN-containing flavoprotein (pyridoxamine 5'-phosphate oxidase superfamily)